jgi:O-antigen ligase
VAECLFYGILLALPFEQLVPANVSITKWLGLVFLTASLGEARTFYRAVPRALLFYFGYVVIGTSVDFARGPLDLAALNEFLRPTFMGVLMIATYNLVLARGPKRILLVLGLSSALYATFEAFGLASGLQELNSAAVDRIGALESDPNFAACFIALSCVLGVSLGAGLFRARLSYRIVGFAVAAIGVIGIVKTSSRGGLLALAVGLLAIAVTTRGMFSRVKILGLLLLALGASGYAAWQSDLFRGRVQASVGNADTAGRLVIWAEAISLARERPIVGYGNVTYASDLGQALGRERRPTHNLFLYVLLGSGLVGAAFFLPFYLRGALAAWRQRKEGLGRAVFPLFAVCVAASLSLNLEIAKWSWSIIAVALATDEMARRRQKPEATRSMRTRGVGG